MTDRVYVHVGSPKSGTTYLQRVLRHNQRELADQGVLVAGKTHVELVHAGFVVREDARLDNLPPRAAGRLGPDRRAGPRLPRPHRDHQLRAPRRREAQAGGRRARRPGRPRGPRRGHDPRPRAGGVVGLAGAAQVRPRRTAGRVAAAARVARPAGRVGLAHHGPGVGRRRAGAPGCRPSASTSSRRPAAGRRAASCGTGSRRHARSRTSRSTWTSRPRTSRWASRQRRCCAR